MTSGGSLGFLGVFCTCPFVACFLLLGFGAVLFAAFSLSLSVSVSLSESASNRFWVLSGGEFACRFWALVSLSQILIGFFHLPSLGIASFCGDLVLPTGPAGCCASQSRLPGLHCPAPWFSHGEYRFSLVETSKIVY